MSSTNILRLLLMVAGYLVFEEIQLTYGSDSPAKVNCGCHIADSCAQCGTEPNMCNGDCVWVLSKCVSKNDILEHFFDEKTLEYGNLKNFGSFKEKWEWIKNDLLTYSKPFNTKHLHKSSPRKQEILESFGQDIFEHFITHEHHDNLLTVLDEMMPGLLQQASNDHEIHNIFIDIIEAAKSVSKLTKPHVQGGIDKLSELFKAIVAHTEKSNMTLQELDESEDRGWKDCNSCGCKVGKGVLMGPKIVFGPLWPLGSAILGGITCEAKKGGCFATTGEVETMTGYKKVSQLVIGDLIRTSSEGDNTHFTEFLGWLDRQKSAPVEMVEIQTTKEISTLTLTANHIVFTSNSTKYANDLQAGDCLIYWNGTHTVDKMVTQVRQTFEVGFWAPLTRDGTLLVNGYLASSYASFPHKLADMAMFPLKAIPTILLDDEESQHKDGVRSVVKMLKNMGEIMGTRRTKPNLYDPISTVVNGALQMNLFTTKNEL